MIFLNYIDFKHGKLRRGEKCLWRGHDSVYLGSYVENHHTIHIIRTNAVYGLDGLPMIDEYVVQCEDKNEIVCIHQQEKPLEGQMLLC